MRLSSRASIFFGVGALVVIGAGIALFVASDDDGTVRTEDGAAATRGENAANPAALTRDPRGPDGETREPEHSMTVPPTPSGRAADAPLLTGFVRDADGGGPLSGASVAVLANGGEQTTTDARGAFSLGLVRPDGVVHVHAAGYLPEDWGYPPGPVNTRPDERGPIPSSHDFALMKNALGTVLTVHGKRPDGSAAGGTHVAVRLRVSALSESVIDVAGDRRGDYLRRMSAALERERVADRLDDPRSDRLDVDGMARFELAVPGRYEIELTDYGLVARALVAAEGGEIDQSLTLAPGVTLQVSALRGGAPVPAAEVELWRAGAGAPLRAGADDHGVATFSGLVARTPIVLRCGPRDRGAERALQVPDASQSRPIVLDLPPAQSPRFRFQVVAAESGHGLRSANVSVADQPPVGCDAVGRFDGELPGRPDDVVTFECEDRRPRRLTLSAVAAAGPTIALDAIGKFGTRVRFRAVDEGGAPAAGAHLETSAMVLSADGLAIGNVSVDGPRYSGADGFCGDVAVDLREGEWLEVYGERIDDNVPYAVQLRGVAVRVLPGQDRIVTLSNAIATVRGKVTLAGSAPTVRPIQLFVSRPSDLAIALSEPVPEQEARDANADGTFEVTVPPGPITITARFGRCATSKTIIVPADGCSGIEIDLLPAREVRVECVDAATGEPILRPVFPVGAAAKVDAVGATFLVPRGGEVSALVRARGYAPEEIHLRDEDRPSEIRIEMHRLK